MKYYIVFIFIFLSFLGCKTPSQQANKVSVLKDVKVFKKPVSKAVGQSYSVLIQGNNFKPGLSSIIRTQKELDHFYYVLYGNSLKAPKIDFSKRAIVAASAGPFSTGGYSIAPIFAIKKEKSVKLIFEIKSPRPTEMVTQAVTQPYVIVSVAAKPDTDILVEIRGMPKKQYDKLNF